MWVPAYAGTYGCAIFEARPQRPTGYRRLLRACRNANDTAADGMPMW